MKVTAKFAEWVSTFTYADLPAPAIETAKRSILDWFGCALLGSTRTAGQIATRYSQAEGGTGRSTVIVAGLLTTATHAAFANGVMGHVEDFDDGGSPAGHTACFLTPSSLALAEELQKTGRDLILAWIVGFEVATRMGLGLRPDRPWHPTPVYGTLGAAAAAGKLLGLDEHGLRMTLGIAASEAAGLTRNFGTMTKSFHAANAARSGVMAAKLADLGYESDPDIIEGLSGYADCFGGDKCDLKTMTDTLGDLLMISHVPPIIKAWPTCSSNHRSITGVLDLFASGVDVHVEDVVAVEHYGPKVPGSGSLHRRPPLAGLQGKFCLEYNIAAALIDRQVDSETFSDSRFRRGDIQDLMKRITLFQSEAKLHSSRTSAVHDGQRLRIVLRNGVVHDLELGPRRTLKGEQVVEKFHLNAGRVLEAGTADKVVGMLRALEEIDDLGELTTLVAERASSPLNQ